MDITCPKCGATNRNTSRFCARCGEALPTTAQNAGQEDTGSDLNLPWLQAVQERAVQRTGHLRPSQIGEPEGDLEEEAPTPSASTEAAPSSAPVEPPAEAQQAQPEQPAVPSLVEEPAVAATEEQPKKGSADEPPPEWVVGILEPGTAPQAGMEGEYEPEEMAHIMPWLGGKQGEGGEGAPPAQPGLPPWLSGITVQETLDTRQGPETAQQQPTAPSTPPALDAELEGVQPFVPPEIQPGAGPSEQGTPAAAAAQEQDKVPDWVKRLESKKAPPAREEEEVQPQLERITPVTKVVLSPTETLGASIIREVPVRPPRPGAVETLASLIQNPPNSAPHAVPSPTSILRPTALSAEAGRSSIVRWLLPDGVIYLAILAALLAVLMIRPPFGAVNAPSAADAIQFYNVVDSAPKDKPALVVFDWDASRSAEMSALSQAVTNHLMSRRMQFVTISTVPQGPGFAQQITQDAANNTKASYGYTYGRDYLVLGYLPGGEAALRSLGGDITSILPLDYVNNSPVVNTDIARGGKIRTLQDFGVVIDLAADETALRTWVEQVASRSGVPMVAAVPQALEPLARPYRNIPGAGLRAVVSGQTGALQYEQQLAAHNLAGGAYSTQSLEDRLNAQSVAQLIVALAILAAFVNMGARRIFRR